MLLRPDAALSLPRSSGRTSPVLLSLCIACAAVLVWIGLAAWMNQSQLQDSLEEFVWGQSLEWGYWKHPPLTTWLMWGALKLFGSTPLVTYGLAALLTMVAIVCTTRLAQLLAGDDVAAVTALMLALHYGFTRRAQMYNHNTVLVACVAVAALLAVLAVRRNRPLDWVAAGLAAGLAVLTKYQAGLPLAGIALAIVLAGELRRCRAGLAIAIGIAALVVLPHVVWMARHDFETLTYAMSYVGAVDGAKSGGRAGRVFAIQIKYFLPVGAFALLLWALTIRIARPDPAAGPRWVGRQRAWLAGLVLFPLGALLCAVAAGVRVQAHWGLQTSQFLVLPIAVWLVRRFGPWRPAHWVAWGVVQAVALGVFVAQGEGLLSPPRDAGVRSIPAARIAQAALAHWRAATGCELRYLSGPVAMVGMVSAYAGRPLLALEDDDPRKSPWIDREDMRARGWLQLRSQPTPEHADGELVVQLPQTVKPSTRYLVFEVRAPAVPCQAAPASSAAHGASAG